MIYAQSILSFLRVKITTTDCFATEGRIFTLTRKQNENQ